MKQIGQAALILMMILLLFGCYPLPEIEEGEDIRAASVDEIATGDAERGRDLFMGYKHFKYEGPTCMGCHNIGEHGILGGGAMGPDLTQISVYLSQEEIIGIMANTGPISPVMQPIYADTPLTVQEQVDLLAFMEASVDEHETDKELLVIAVSIAGAVVGTGMLGLLYRGRLRSVRRALIKKAQAENR